jgi:predicted nuclease of predicted toxin-antitoxin system
MKVLLDEQLPVKLKFRLQNVCEVSTVRDENWLGIKNGELLQLCVDNGFNVFITNDKSLYYQQKISTLHILVININQASNRYEDILPVFIKLRGWILKIPNLSFPKNYLVYPNDFE